MPATRFRQPLRRRGRVPPMPALALSSLRVVCRLQLIYYEGESNFCNGGAVAATRRTKRELVVRRDPETGRIHESAAATWADVQDTRVEEHLSAADPVRAGVEEALLRRVEQTMRASVRRMTASALMRAVEAPTPAATIAQIISAAPDVGLTQESSWSRALARGAARKQEMIQRAGGVLSSGQVAELLDISVSAVNQRKNKHRSILAVPLSGGEWGFPTRQFADGQIRKGVAEVVKAAAGEMNPWVLLSILLDPVDGEGGPTLLDRLDDDVIRADVLNRVRTYGEHVAV
jgi:hypothetical protein